MVSVAVDGVTYQLPARKTKSVLVETKNWGKVNFALDERYKKLDYLGEGSYGVVIATEDTTDKDSKVAVKGVIGLFSGSNSHLDPIRKIAREVRISRQVDHPHVIKLIDAYVPPNPEFDHVYLMFEHMDKSLWKVRPHLALVSPGQACRGRAIHPSRLVLTPHPPPTTHHRWPTGSTTSRPCRSSGSCTSSSAASTTSTPSASCTATWP